MASAGCARKRVDYRPGSTPPYIYSTFLGFHTLFTLQEKPEATGQRIVVSQSGVWMRDLAQAARPVFEPLGYKPPQRNLPTPLLKLVGLVVPRCVMRTHTT